MYMLSVEACEGELIYHSDKRVVQITYNCTSRSIIELDTFLSKALP